jgi:Flp pilus assembly protein TadB
MTALASPLIVARRLFGSAASIAETLGATLLELQSGRRSPLRRLLLLGVGLLLFVLGLATLLGLVAELVGLYALIYGLAEALSRLLGTLGE